MTGYSLGRSSWILCIIESQALKLKSKENRRIDLCLTTFSWDNLKQFLSLWIHHKIHLQADRRINIQNYCEIHFIQGDQCNRWKINSLSYYTGGRPSAGWTRYMVYGQQPFHQIPGSYCLTVWASSITPQTRYNQLLARDDTAPVSQVLTPGLRFQV